MLLTSPKSELRGGKEKRGSKLSQTRRTRNIEHFRNHSTGVCSTRKTERENSLFGRYIAKQAAGTYAGERTFLRRYETRVPEEGGKKITENKVHFRTRSLQSLA
jgi:hypothetical protein